MNIKFKLMSIALVLAGFFLLSCNDDSNEMPNSNTKGQTSIEMTDAPIDDANIRGVFVTVTDVKVDGESFAGFSGKQTFDLMALQNGNTKVLANGELDAKAYSNITFVLDYQSDASGNAPGCYILTANNEKQRLESSASSTGEVVVNKSYDVKSTAQNKIVADFDLRKAIKYSDDADRDFEFVSDNELRTSVRVVDGNASGTINGTYQEEITSESGKVVVFAYQKGTFNADTETQKKGEAQIRFASAVSSSVVSKTSGDYNLSFLEEGEYELHFASYKDTDQDGEYTFDAMLDAELEVNGNVSNTIMVESNSQVNVSTKITGLLN